MRNDHQGEKENSTKEDLKCGDYDNEDKSGIEIDENTEGSISGEVDNSAEDNFIQDFSPDIPITKQRYHTPKIFQDAITVVIPLDVTADLKIAIKKTRAKRILSIYKKFPSLQKKTKKTEDKTNLNDDDEPMLDEEDEDNAKEKDVKRQPDKKKKMEHVPQPEQFGSVLDYLEAKYVKGVMLEEDDAGGGPELDEKSEGQGSVYSRDSFLDDTDLQRDVAEQVMASTTLTKLELEHEDGGDFFVNVGTLEVENDDYGDNYDPLLDKENKTKTTKKRKKSASAASAAATSTTPASKNKKSKTEQQPQKKHPSSAKSTKSKKSTTSMSPTSPIKSKPSDDKKTGDKAAKLAAKKIKAHSDALFKKAIGMIKKLTSEELPRRTTKRKVALKCPKNKKPGDDITFTNPHNPGQKLRVKVPKDCFSGGTFKVTVPVKHHRGEDEKDCNKLPRELQEFLDDFGKAYDEWCTAQSKVDSSFETFKEKQGKFHKISEAFPSGLITPIDPDYLKQVVRRARQNKYKRSKTAAKNIQTKHEATEMMEEEASKENNDEDIDDDDDDDNDQLELKKYRVVEIPSKGVNYPIKTWSAADFALNA